MRSKEPLPVFKSVRLFTCWAFSYHKQLYRRLIDLLGFNNDLHLIIRYSRVLLLSISLSLYLPIRTTLLQTDTAWKKSIPSTCVCVGGVGLHVHLCQNKLLSKCEQITEQQWTCGYVCVGGGCLHTCTQIYHDLNVSELELMKKEMMRMSQGDQLKNPQYCHHHPTMFPRMLQCQMATYLVLTG